eukprot:12881212-Prorocentrum_lima.AAC.1
MYQQLMHAGTRLHKASISVSSVLVMATSASEGVLANSPTCCQGEGSPLQRTGPPLLGKPRTGWRCVGYRLAATNADLLQPPTSQA